MGRATYICQYVIDFKRTLIGTSIYCRWTLGMKVIFSLFGEANKVINREY